MLSISSQRKASGTSVVVVQEKNNPGESTTTESALTEAPEQDRLVLSAHTEAPKIERPLNFVTNYSNDVFVETDLFVRLRNQLPSIFQEYFKGNVDKESLLRTLDHAVSDMVGYYGSKGLDPADTTQDILKDFYRFCRIFMVDGADSASFVEGKRVAQELGCSSSYVYYNSDYYYKSEDLIDTVHDHFEALSIKYGCGQMELERDFPKGDVRNTRYASYNADRNSSLREIGGSMIDWTMPPPRGFKMLYDTNNRGMNRYAASMGVGNPDEPSVFDSAVYIQYKGWNFAHRIPVRMDPTRYPISVHLMDIIKQSGHKYPEEIEDFLDNFDFFATSIGKEYTDAHPLSY